jgi:hypothetical protein
VTHPELVYSWRQKKYIQPKPSKLKNFLAAVLLFALIGAAGILLVAFIIALCFPVGCNPNIC